MNNYLPNDELDAQHCQTGFLKDFPIKILKDFGVKVLILLSDIFEWIDIFSEKLGIPPTSSWDQLYKIISPFHLPLIAKRCTGDETGIVLTVTD